MKHLYNQRAAQLGLSIIALSVTSVPVMAQQAAPTPYLGITKGGPISAEDRVATDERRRISTAAEISNQNDVLVATFSLDMSIVSGVKESEEKGVHFYSANLTNISVKATAPLNSAEEGSLVDFRTFGNDGKLTIGFNNYRAKLVAPSSTRTDLGKFARTCVTKAGGEWLKPLNASRQAAGYAEVSDYLAKLDAQLNRFNGQIPPDSAIALASADAADGSFAKAARDACGIGGSGGLINETQYALRFGADALGEEQYAAWRQRNLAPQGTFFWGAEVSIGYNRYSILDRPTVSVGVKDRIGFDVNARAGWVFGSDGMVLLASGGYTRSYKPKDEAEVCGPPDLSGNTTCVSGQDGLPDREETAYASVSLRKVLLRNKNGQPVLGVRPSVTYVFDDKAWQFELPVYLQRSEDGGLDAGVRAIFNTGSDKFGLGAFIGVPF